jgi:hypothetical protein
MKLFGELTLKLRFKEELKKSILKQDDQMVIDKLKDQNTTDRVFIHAYKKNLSFLF